MNIVFSEGAYHAQQVSFLDIVKGATLKLLTLQRSGINVNTGDVLFDADELSVLGLQSEALISSPQDVTSFITKAYPIIRDVCARALIKYRLNAHLTLVDVERLDVEQYAEWLSSTEF